MFRPATAPCVYLTFVIPNSAGMKGDGWSCEFVNWIALFYEPRAQFLSNRG